ncbi:MAG: hypothetical protein ACK5AZ_08565 [Bryobacteraceae bacterium]
MHREPRPEAVQAPTPYRWYHKAAALLSAIFCFELGAFLLIFPWLDHWDNNYAASLHPLLGSVWNRPEFRGAISGLGLVNFYVGLGEVFRLRRFSAAAKLHQQNEDRMQFR